jgi:hypothetical protein
MSQVRREDAERGEYTLSSAAFAVHTMTILPCHLVCQGVRGVRANRIRLASTELQQELHDTTGFKSAP